MTTQTMTTPIDEQLLFAEPLGVVYENGRQLIRGYATVFNKETPVFYGMADVISPSAFDDALDQDIFALYAHNFDNVLGRTSSGTLRLHTDRKGLLMEIDPPDTTLAHDLMESMRRGDVTGGSMGITFSNDAEQYTVKNKGQANEYTLRRIQKVDRLYEVTITPIPRIKEAQVGLARARFDAQQEREMLTTETVPGLTLAQRQRRLRLASLM